MALNIIVNPENKGSPGINGELPSAPTRTLAQDAADTQVMIYGDLSRLAPELVTPSLSPTTVFNGSPVYTPPGTSAAVSKRKSMTLSYDPAGGAINLWLWDAVRQLFWLRAYVSGYPVNLFNAIIITDGFAMIVQLYPNYVTLLTRSVPPVQQW